MDLIRCRKCNAEIHRQSSDTWPKDICLDCYLISSEPKVLRCKSCDTEGKYWLWPGQSVTECRTCSQLIEV